MSLQPNAWRSKISQLSGLSLAEVTNVSYGWTTVQRDKVLLFVEAAYNNNPDALKLAAVLTALQSHRESGSPSVKKLLADVDTALL